MIAQYVIYRILSSLPSSNPWISKNRLILLLAAIDSEYLMSFGKFFYANDAYVFDEQTCSSKSFDMATAKSSALSSILRFRGDLVSIDTGISKTKMDEAINLIKDESSSRMVKFINDNIKSMLLISEEQLKKNVLFNLHLPGDTNRFTWDDVIEKSSLMDDTLRDYLKESLADHRYFIGMSAKNA